MSSDLYIPMSPVCVQPCSLEVRAPVHQQVFRCKDPQDRERPKPGNKAILLNEKQLFGYNVSFVMFNTQVSFWSAFVRLILWKDPSPPGIYLVLCSHHYCREDQWNFLQGNQIKHKLLPFVQIFFLSVELNIAHSRPH